MRTFDITAFGELLIDYTGVGLSPSGMELFEQNPGGAPANVLACAAKLGQKTAFIGKIGADTQVRREDLDLSIIRNSGIFHFGSLSLTDSPARETTLFTLEEAKKAGCITSFDPNYRPLLWKSEAQAKEQMRTALRFADIIKLSDEETELLTGQKDPVSATSRLIDGGIKIAAVTLGKNGALIAAKDGCETVRGFEVNAIDTTGAGDAFWGAFLYSVGALGKAIDKIDLEELRELARFANAATALCVTKRGAIPAMPSLREIEELLMKKE